MLLKREQGKHLKVADIEDDTYYFVNDGTATEEDKEKLRKLDCDYVSIYGKHMILNYQDLA